MAPKLVNHTIEVTLKSHTPVFVAGSFSEPAWEPFQMQPEHYDSNGTTYRTSVLVQPGVSYQYKFKSGRDVWFLDETAPTETDEKGNKNNLLIAPSTVDESEAGRKSSIASQPAVPLLDVDLEEELDEDPLQTPLLAHESFGMFAAPRSEKGGWEGFEARPAGRAKPTDYAIEEVDPSDPTLERFPSDRHSVMETLRKIQSRQSEDSVDEVLTLSHNHSHRGSSDSTAESLGPSSPVSGSPTATKRREHRLSHGAPLTETVSLGSIAEEDG